MTPDERQLLRDSVSRFMKTACDFSLRRGWSQSDPGYSKDVWLRFVQLGWLGIGIPERAGGSGGDLADIAAVMEELGRGLAAEPYLASAVLAGPLFAELGSKRQIQTYLEPMLQNGDVLSLAFAERGSRFDSNLVSMRAERSGADWLLNGEKIFVLNGAEASCFVVSARTSGNPGDAQGVSLFLVPRGSDGLNLQSYAVLDGRRACDLVLRDVRIDDTLRLGALGEGSLPLQRILDRGAVASCAEAIGAMWQALETTVSYLKQRVQFGRPLIQFQALQHRLVDMHIAIREAAVMTRRATNETWADDRARQAATSAAKVMVGRAMRLVGPGCVQLHGAVGTTDECVISHYYKRLSVLEPMFGNTDWHVKRLTKLRSAVGGLVLASAATGH